MFMPPIYFLATPCNFPRFGTTADRLGSRRHGDEITSQFAMASGSLVLPWWDSILRQHSFSPLDSLSSSPGCSLQSLVSFFAWLIWHNVLLTSRIFVRGAPFDIHIRGLPHRISRDTACSGTTHSLVSVDRTDRVSLGYMVDRWMVVGQTVMMSIQEVTLR